MTPSESALATRWRLLLASFFDTAGGRTWRGRLGEAASEARELLLYAFAEDTGLLPELLDSEHIRALLEEILPGRLEGKEPYARDLPDLIEEFLVHVAAEEGLARAWEWTRAVDAHREAFAAALRDASRTRLGHAARHQPERRAAAKIGRNDPCPCGSGRKYKHCCGKPA